MPGKSMHPVVVGRSPNDGFAEGPTVVTAKTMSPAHHGFLIEIWSVFFGGGPGFSSLELLLFGSVSMFFVFF